MLARESLSGVVQLEVQVQCCFTSTKTTRTLRERGAQDGHLDSHTAPELCTTSRREGVRLRACTCAHAANAR